MVDHAEARGVYAYRVAYDGRPYHGFQRQPDVTTVEGRLLAALAELDLAESADSPPPCYAAAGRTDAGVSAVSQTVAFAAPDWAEARVLNDAVPDSIAVWARAVAPSGFHATHAATRRSYRYHLDGDSLDESLLRDAVDVLSGHHDVRHLCASSAAEPRVTTITIHRLDGWFALDFHAPGFARQQVRRTVAAITAVAAGAVPFGRLGALLSADALPGHHGVGPAPAEALVLTDVEYPSLAFRRDTDAVEDARDMLRRAQRRTRTRLHLLETMDTSLH